jgi:hypothetical protein
MNKGVARAIEALTGGVPVALGGAAVGAATYSPKDPREWEDEQGRFHRRKLTKKEKKERSKRALRGAALGGTAGATGGLGYSLYKRTNLTSAEAREANAVVGRALEGLQDVITHDIDLPQQGLFSRMNPFYVQRAQGRAKTLAKAKKFLVKQEEALMDLLQTAQQARARKPFGGYRRGGINRFSEYGDELGMEAGATPWSPETHPGLVHKKIMDLKKKHNLPDPNLDPPGFWHGLLEAKGIIKTAQEAAFVEELAKLEGIEKVAIRETLRVGWKAGKEAFQGGTKLKAGPGSFLPQRQQAVQHGTGLMEALKKRGIQTHRARVKTPASIAAKGLTEVPDDLLGMQGYVKNPGDLKRLLNALRKEGVTIDRSSAKMRPGYHGINIKGTYKGVPIEYQASPGRVSNMGSIMEHSLGYKQSTEAPLANRFDKWVGKKVAPKMVNWDALGPNFDPSWINERAGQLRVMKVET